jgi:RNA polymerase sigma-70 factor (ECF subfamily)
MSHRQNVTDEELVQRAQQGSQAAVHSLVDRYTPSIYRIAFGITRRHQDAEDIVQETFLKLFSNLGQYSPDRGLFKTWLFTIARNQSINAFASLKRSVVRFLADTLEDDHLSYSSHAEDSAGRNPESQLASKQELARVEDALAKLPERQRTALLLKAQEGMSYEEIASVMSASVSSVESLIFRARKRIMELTEDAS